MSKLYIFLSILVVFFIAGSALATVGGPTFIYQFKYNPANESVYYTLIDQGGRGCPPELMKLSLNFGEPETVYSCEDGEKLMQGNGYNVSLVSTEIGKITNSFKDISPINLKNNRVSIDISFVNYENIVPEFPEVKKANFIVSVFQDDKKIIDFPVSGCSLEQPFIFVGYAVPGFDKKIVLLLSTKRGCFEGGYTYESLHVVGGLNNLDKSYFNFYKDSSALVPNEGTLVVFQDVPKLIKEISENKDSKNNVLGPEIVPKLEPDSSGNPIENKKAENTIFYIIGGGILALGVGYLFGKKTKI